jgi:hypothetical protein
VRWHEPAKVHIHVGIKRPLPPPSSPSASASASVRLVSSKPFEGGKWHDKYLLLCEYKARHGHCLVPHRHVDTNSDAKLGAWVTEQRRLHKRGKLSTNRFEMLDDLDFSWDPISDKWEVNCALVERYAAREGHANVPQDHVEADGTKLGRWLEWQRRNMRDGTLEAEHADRLEALGVSWDPFIDQWEHKFDLLRQFKAREGHCHVAFDHQEVLSSPTSTSSSSSSSLVGAAADAACDGQGVKVNLGHWLGKQRHLARRGKLDADREERLTRLGVRW